MCFPVVPHALPTARLLDPLQARRSCQCVLGVPEPPEGPEKVPPFQVLQKVSLLQLEIVN